MDLINQGHSGYQLCQKNTVIIMGDNFTYYSFYRSIRQRRWQKSICCAIACLAISGKPDSMARQRGHPDGKEELPHTTSNFLPDYLYSTGHQTKLTYPSIFSLYNATVRNDLKNPSHSGHLFNIICFAKLFYKSYYMAISILIPSKKAICFVTIVAETDCFLHIIQFFL